MNTTPLARPEVASFVDEVRGHLTDLTDEERDELLGGLEADLSDLVADGSPLGDPEAYAAELRAAAGLPEPARRLPRPTLPRRATLLRALDGGRAWWFDLVQSRPWRRQVWDVASALRPAWWVARAWIAVTTLDVLLGYSEPISLVPSLGHPLWGWLLLPAAVLGSTLLGLGRVWPGSGPDRGVGRRLTLLALNVAAVVLPLVLWSISAPGYLTGSPYGYDGYGAGYRDGLREPGIRANGRVVTNVFAYDARGKPLTDVQLFDQDGRPVSANPYRRCPTPVLGDKRYNVFPLGLKDGPQGCGTSAGEVVPSHPLATVPPVGLPGAEAVEVPPESDEDAGRGDDGRRERDRESRQSER